MAAPALPIGQPDILGTRKGKRVVHIDPMTALDPPRQRHQALAVGHNTLQRRLSELVGHVADPLRIDVKAGLLFIGHVVNQLNDVIGHYGTILIPIDTTDGYFAIGEVGFQCLRGSVADEMTYDVIAKVAALEWMEFAELKRLWEDIFSEPAPNTRNRSYLNPRLAYRIQELAYGGLPEPARKQLDDLVDGKEKTKSPHKLVKKPTVGTRLIREYHGVEHQVTVTRTGFEYQGRTYRSLSHIAREITGTRWSGPLFFGIAGKGKNK